VRRPGTLLPTYVCGGFGSAVTGTEFNRWSLLFTPLL